MSTLKQDETEKVVQIFSKKDTRAKLVLMLNYLIATEQATTPVMSVLKSAIRWIGEEEVAKQKAD